MGYCLSFICHTLLEMTKVICLYLLSVKFNSWAIMLLYVLIYNSFSYKTGNTEGEKEEKEN